MNPAMAPCVAYDDPTMPERVGEVLRRGGRVILPTDTLYGLSVRADDVAAVAGIRELKGIASPRAFVALIDAMERLDAWLAREQDTRSVEWLRSVWPAPLTAILRVRDAPAWGTRTPEGWTAAFRLPADATLRRVIAQVGSPVLSTSVNRTGEAPVNNAAAIASDWADRVDLWVRREPGEGGIGQASTLVDATAWPPRVLRPGPVAVPEAAASPETPPGRAHG